MNIYLLGYRFSGKTTVGKALAEALDLQFMDMDTMLAREAEMPVTQIVKEMGWEEFHRRQRELMATLSGLIGFVVATSGTTAIDPENLRFMKQSGPAIWLKAGAKTIQSRAVEKLGAEKANRRFSDSKSLEKIETVLEKRTPYYEAAMRFSISTDNIPVNMICELIVERLGQLGLLPRK